MNSLRIKKRDDLRQPSANGKRFARLAGSEADRPPTLRGNPIDSSQNVLISYGR